MNNSSVTLVKGNFTDTPKPEGVSQVTLGIDVDGTIKTKDYLGNILQYGGTSSIGYLGPQGYQGSIGFGTTGSQGAVGIQGLTGPQGSFGYQGVQGFSGFNGANGSQGSQGYQGVIGSGYQGNQGPIGSGSDPEGFVKVLRVAWGGNTITNATSTDNIMPSGGAVSIPQSIPRGTLIRIHSDGRMNISNETGGSITFKVILNDGIDKTIATATLPLAMTTFNFKTGLDINMVSRSVTLDSQTFYVDGTVNIFGDTLSGANCIPFFTEEDIEVDASNTVQLKITGRFSDNSGESTISTELCTVELLREA